MMLLNSALERQTITSNNYFKKYFSGGFSNEESLLTFGASHLTRFTGYISTCESYEVAGIFVYGKNSFEAYDNIVISIFGRLL